MGIFDAINNYSTQVGNSKPQAWGVTAAPTFQNLGVTQTNNPVPVGSIDEKGAARISNGRYLVKYNTGQTTPLQYNPTTRTNYGGDIVYALRDAGPAQTNHQGILGPNAAGWTNAAAIQQEYMNKYKAELDARANPNNSNSYYTAPTYNSMTNAINSAYGQASQSYSNLAPNIQSLVEKYGVNPNLFPDQEAQNAELSNSYSRAKAQYGELDMPTDYTQAGNGQTGITNLNQMYGKARDQFNKYTDAGNMAIDRLRSIQEGTPEAIDQVLNNPLIQMQLNQGLKAVNQSASAQGMLRSGQTLKQLQQLGMANAGNAVQQYQQNLLNTANLGNAAGGSVAALYSQQNAAEMERAKQMGALDTGGAQAVASNRLSQAQAQQQATQAQQDAHLRALGLSQSNAGVLSKLLTEQNAAAVAENTRTFENNAASSQASFMSKDAASRAYLAQLLNLNNAAGQAEATRQYGLNSIAQYNSF